jgi:hypothetical protein
MYFAPARAKFCDPLSLVSYFAKVRNFARKTGMEVSPYKLTSGLARLPGLKFKDAAASYF